MDDRLRQFSPPPWAALGRRDPNHEQAPWRESENLEWKVNPSWREWGRALVQDDLPYLPERIIGNLSAMGQRPASDELMQKHMQDASDLLPRSNVDIEAPYRIPYYAEARAEGGPVASDDRGVLERMWDARPWKDQLNKPVDYTPLSLALGLLHPRLGSSMRDVGMARSLMGKGKTPAIVDDPGVPFGAGNQLETLGMPYAARPGAQPPTANSNRPAVMHPERGPVMDAPGNANPAPASSAPSGRMALYEAELSRLERAGVPYEQWPTYRSFIQDLPTRAEGGSVQSEPQRQHSFSQPLSGFIDKVTGALKQYGRDQMDNAGFAPWAKTAGNIGMEAVLAPATSISAASKLATAPMDWATGREVMARPWDVVEALPLAAVGGLRAAKHALDVSDLTRRARAAESFLETKRAKGEFLPADLRIKQLIDDMAARTKWD